jgi:hypothetical protein
MPRSAAMSWRARPPAMGHEDDLEAIAKLAVRGRLKQLFQPFGLGLS